MAIHGKSYERISNRKPADTSTIGLATRRSRIADVLLPKSQQQLRLPELEAAQWRAED